MTDLRNKTIICYTFSVRPTFPESKKVKITIKKFDEEENEDFFEDKYFNFENLIFGAEKTFWKIFAQDGVYLAELNIDFRKVFVKASSS